MSHSLTSLKVHCIFSTKYRQNLIGKDFKERLWAYMGGIARKNEILPLAIGGTENHVHLLIQLPAKHSVSKAVQLIKAGSSMWFSKMSPSADFSWQEGYAAFSVRASDDMRVMNYILDQEKHHAKKNI